MAEPIASAKFPAWVRTVSIIWLALWAAVYWRFWGVQNFLHLCDIAVILTCVGLWASNSLLLSSQAVSSILIDLIWDLDAAWRFFTGNKLTGGTEYMWNAHYPLWVRLLSLFHIVWPVILIGALLRVGYARRGLPLQCVIAAAAMIASRFASSSLNINYVFRDPIWQRSWGPAPAHVALMWIGLVIIIYVPTHFLLAKFLPKQAVTKP